MKIIRKTNKEFAAQDKGFRDICVSIKIKPTTRQASKWRNQKGIAYKYEMCLF